MYGKLIKVDAGYYDKTLPVALGDGVLVNLPHDVLPRLIVTNWQTTGFTTGTSIVIGVRGLGATAASDYKLNYKSAWEATMAWQAAGVVTIISGNSPADNGNMIGWTYVSAAASEMGIIPAQRFYISVVNTVTAYTAGRLRIGYEVFA
jgi:hypothetical protein